MSIKLDNLKINISNKTMITGRQTMLLIIRKIRYQYFKLSQKVRIYSLQTLEKITLKNVLFSKLKCFIYNHYYCSKDTYKNGL